MHKNCNILNKFRGKKGQAKKSSKRNLHSNLRFSFQLDAQLCGLQWKINAVKISEIYLPALYIQNTYSYIQR